jgi:transglutaminase-like putative cysteine protease
MRSNIIASSSDAVVIATARGIVSNIDGRNTYGQAMAIRGWLSEHLRFVRDPVAMELLSEPRWLVEEVRRRGYVQGDCDDAATLGAALARAIGISGFLDAVAFWSDRAPYQHVYAVLKVAKMDGSDTGNGASRPVLQELDTTRPAQYDAPTVSRRLRIAF